LSRRQRGGIWLASAGCLLALLILGALTAYALPVGKLTQLGGTAGCVSETGNAGTCVNGKALDTPQGVAVSPDGTSVYVASENTDGVASLKRNTTNGALTQVTTTAGCVTETGSAGTCADGKALDGARSVAVSPDNKNVYVTALRTDAVAVFRRTTTSGQLTQLTGTAGCISESGTGGLCVNGKALENPSSVVVSGDGKNVYIASDSSDAVAAFSRNATTGALTQLTGTAGCISEDGSLGTCVNGKALDGASSVALSADGATAYVASANSNAVAAFKRNTTSGQLTQLASTAGCVSDDGTLGTCANGKALLNPVSVAVSRDGKSVYVASLFSNAIAVFARSTSVAPIGKLTQLTGLNGCVSEDGTDGAGGTCINGKALNIPLGVAVSPDGTSVYAASSFDAVAAFARSTSAAPVGKLTQLASTAGCVSETGAGPCLDGKALLGPSAVVVSANNKNVYATSAGSNAVASFARDTGP
jgi:DNA-binding beta-propeller fold protein YncE